VKYPHCSLPIQEDSLALEYVLQYPIQIFDALNNAHRKGVMHRDQKPANLMLIKSGVKLLVSGLTKLKQKSAPSNAALSALRR
jgi:serine/threonine protein kinase